MKKINFKTAEARDSLAFCGNEQQVKSNLHYTRGITAKSVTSVKWQGSSPPLSIWATQRPTNVAAVTRCCLKLVREYVHYSNLQYFRHRTCRHLHL